MRRYIYRDNQMSTYPRRREIREAVTEDMNQRPENPMTAVRMPVIPSITTRSMENMMYGDPIEIHQMVFESICFTTAKWIEEHTDDDTMTSCGHYNMYNSYFQVPQGVDLPQVELMNNGNTHHDEDTEPYRGMDGEAYYRFRMIELQARIDAMESRTRPVGIPPIAPPEPTVPENEEYFESELFEVE
jgi:hypothetical protein